MIIQPVPVRGHLCLHRDRHKDVRRLPNLHSAKTRTRYTDYSHQCSIYRQRLIENPRVGSKVSRPVSVTENEYLAGANYTVVIRCEQSPKGGAYSEHVEIIPGYQF